MNATADGGDDPDEMWNHRVVGSCSDNRMMWITPDREVLEGFDTKKPRTDILEVRPYDGSKLPAGIKADEAYRDKDAEQGKS